MSAGRLLGGLWFPLRWAVCVLWMSSWCSNKKRLLFQWDPTDACLNEGGEGRGTGGGNTLLLHVHLRVGDCFWFWIRIEDELEAAHRPLRMCRVKSWREYLWESQSLNREQMSVLGCPEGGSFSLHSCCRVLVILLSLLLSACVSRLSESTEREKPTTHKETNPKQTFKQCRGITLQFLSPRKCCKEIKSAY